MKFVTLLCCSLLLVFVAESTSADEAPCEIDGVVYQSGELTPDPCDRCRCWNGEEICNRMGCFEGLYAKIKGKRIIIPLGLG
ncbi:hypothetical protein Btru_069664 [Bulinus truncatus]|nr:hypothetical protein Btru_069664 [Bulinus truncatus]